MAYGLPEGFGKDVYHRAFFPEIRLAGKWIRECGFEARDKLTVKVYHDRIVIEKEKPGTIDPKVLAREQKAHEKSLQQRIKELVSPDIFEQLRFEKGTIK